MSKTPSKRSYEKSDHLGHIRKRPDTYVGSARKQKFEDQYVADLSVDKPGLVQKNIVIIPAMLRIFVEIVSNAIDNIYRSKEEKILMTKIKINIEPSTGEISVMNDGAWIPLELHESTNLYIPNLIFGVLLTSDNYDDSRVRGGSGRNGYGAKLTNVFSTMFKVEIGVPDGDGLKVYSQSWSDGMTSCNNPTFSNKKTGSPYTQITWIPDFSYFKLKGYSESLLSLYHRYVYDSAMIAGCDNVAVYLNKKKLPISGLRDYSKLYGTSKEIMQFKTKDSLVVLTPAKQFGFVSFTNGVQNSEGGIHVEEWSKAIFRPLLPRFNKKNKPQVNIRDIKQFFRIFIKCDLPNPEFSSQSKTYLTTPSPTVYVSKKNIDALMKWDFASKVRDIIQGKELLTLKKIEKKKKTFQKIPGYDPANNAGSKDANKCVLIFTEGLSAKTYAVRGIEKGIKENGEIVQGRDWFGIFPLRGKLLNVRNAKTASIAANKEIKNAINALGLRIGVDYTDDKNFNTLNYGRVAILCDADVDGIHIQGLLINFFHTLYPSLFRRTKPFIFSMETPIVRVFEGRKVHVFYDEFLFKEFIKDPTKKNLRKKYHKGLGTSSNKEVMETFGERIVKYKKDDDTDDRMDMLFNSTKSDDRKTWLANFKPGEVSQRKGKIISMSVSDFINQKMIRFSIDDCARSIPHLLDGLKESQRKILYAIFLKNLKFNGKSLKVAQLAGWVAEKTGYHHGEQCLYDTITKLANDIVGMGNIPLLFRDGQFGTRLEGGKDASAGRYIFTKLDQLTRLIFREMDDFLLPRRIDDGEIIEPRFYIPIIPMILVNGCQAGIGTGWSCNLPTFNPLDLISCCESWIKTKTIPEIQPWFRNHKGKVEKIDTNKYLTRGVFERDKNKVTITELPIGVWTDKYKDFLEDLLEKKLIKSLKNYSTPQKVKFVIIEHRNGLKCNMTNLKLTKTVTTTNMVLFTPSGRLRKFKKISDIILAFCTCRFTLYKKRRNRQLKETRDNLTLLEDKARFLEMVVSGKLVIFKRTEENVCKDLVDNNFSKQGKQENFDYLLNLPTRTYTREKIQKLQGEIESQQKILSVTENTLPENVWKNELQELKVAYKKWQRKMAT